MMMKQKIIPLMIALNMMAVALTGCGKEQTSVQIDAETAEVIVTSIEENDSVSADSLSGMSSLYDGNDDEYVPPAKAYSEEEWAEINGETFNETGDEEELTVEDIEKMLEGLSPEERVNMLANLVAAGEIPEDVMESLESTFEGDSKDNLDEIKGIIVLVKQPAVSGYFDLSIFSVNPENGTLQEISRFGKLEYNDASFKYILPSSDITANYQELFSNDFSKLAATKVFSANNESHVGWLDINGNFFDVTETLGEAPKSDFEDIRCFRAFGFTPDNIFQYGEYDGDYNRNNLKASYYVSVDELLDNQANCQEGNPFKEAYLRYPAETSPIELGIACDYFSVWRDGGLHAGILSDWIDESHCIVETNTERMLYYTNYGSSIFNIETQELTEYIPGSSRNNYSGVASPDGNQIAFLSEPKESESQRYLDIYITSVDGGEPVKVDCDIPNSDAINVMITLLDWK